MPKFMLFFFTCLLSAWACNNANPSSNSDETTLNFNKNWQFARDIDTTVIPDYFERDSDVDWQYISLPHTAHIEPLVIKDQQWQGTAFYRKFFTISPEDSNKHIAIKFGAAMHRADVYLNGEKVARHKGGYLPFVVNISDGVRFGDENVLLVKLNNEDNATIPPGKPIDNLDFNYFSGLYRNVYLLVDDKLHISDPIEAGREAAGGLLVHYSNVSDSTAMVHVQTDIVNFFWQNQSAAVTTTLTDTEGRVVAKETTNVKRVAADSFRLFKQKLSISNPKLWSPDHPSLYTLKVQLKRDDTIIDSKQIRIGIRTISFNDENQFVLNGKPLFLRGTNRHQSYPYIGYALSDNAQYRGAYKIKKAGFIFVRTAHYPPSPAFIKACDELGILFMDAIPGWQFFGGVAFQKLSFQNTRDMIRRDRNHPSVVIWEASLNESPMTKEFMNKTNKIVAQELPFENVYTAGWIDYKAYDIFIPARQHSKPPDYWNNYSKDKPLFIAEYGDWGYYAQNAGFNQEDYEDLKKEERNSRQLRRDGQKRLAQQALNFQESHNSNLKGPAFGDANWLMFDYNRGYAPNIEASGISDIFRIPKFAFYFYRSQAGPNMEPDAQFGRPMIFIANFWSGSTYKTVKIYSNTDEVELFLNEESIARQLPDGGRISSHLNHPPFTFELETFEPGTLRAVGYIDGETVVEHTRITPGKPVALRLEVDYSGKPLTSGQKDVVFVYASVIDSNGVRIPTAAQRILFSVEGDAGAKIIGKNPIKAEAGIATVLLRVFDETGKITIKAEAEGLETAEIQVIIQK